MIPDRLGAMNRSNHSCPVSAQKESTASAGFRLSEPALVIPQPLLHLCPGARTLDVWLCSSRTTGGHMLEVWARCRKVVDLIWHFARFPSDLRCRPPGR